ncbi:MAG: T9SS type A sorting domain-containing protein [bacterium]
MPSTRTLVAGTHGRSMWTYTLESPPNRPPDAFDLISPVYGDTVDTSSVEFVWNESNDPDPGDSVAFYRVYVALDSTFASDVDSQTVSATELIWNDLEDNQVYWWRVKALDTHGSGTFSNQSWCFRVRLSAINSHELPLQPEKFTLYQNYPNPFNAVTTMQFDLTKRANVSLRIYNVNGQQVAALLNDRPLTPGHYKFQFDGSRLPSGSYIYCLEGSGQSFSRKMVLLK